MWIKTFSFALIFALKAIRAVPDIPLDLQPKGTTLVQKGSSVVITCQVFSSIVMFVDTVITIEHTGVDQNGEKATRKLLKNSFLDEDGDPEFYEVNSNFSEGNVLYFRLKILIVRDVDDGNYTCKAVHERTTVVSEETIQIVVQRYIQSLEMSCQDCESSNVSTSGIKTIDKMMTPMVSSPILIQCTAMGQNPYKENMEIYFDGEPAVSELTKNLIPGGFRRYKVIKKAELFTKAYHSGKTIVCQAQAENNTMLKITWTLDIITYDPDVQCEDTFSSVGDNFPVLVCYVREQGTAVESYYWLRDSDGVRVYPGNKPKDDVMDNAEAKLVPSNDGRTKVTLDLFKAKSWHFDEPFKLVTEMRDGSRVTTMVDLKRKPGTGSENEGGSRGDAGRAVLCPLLLIISMLTLL